MTEAQAIAAGVGVVLDVQDLHVSYGAVKALQGVSLQIRQGEIVTLIGGNGAGKTTLLRTLSGLVRPWKGRIRYFAHEGAGEGENLATLAAHRTVALGLSHVPEGRMVFPELTVLENLELGAYLRPRTEISVDLEKVFALFPRLKERHAQSAGTLSGGEQQMLAIGRAMMGRPRVLLMDEPSLGIAPMLVRSIFAKIKEINAAGTTILLVEQNAHMALSVAHRGYVLETGKIVIEGPAAQLSADENVRRAYLGE